MPVALILVDAMSAAYAGNLPALRALSGDGYSGHLGNIYAYRGIEATLFTGRKPADHGVWGEFRPSQPPRPGGPGDRAARALIAAGDLLPSDRLRLDVRYVAAKLQRTRHLTTGNLIPTAMMPYFTSSIETDIWAANALQVPTLFDEIRAEGGTFETVVYPTIRLDPEVPSWVRARVKRGSLPDFWYIKFSALDALGHKYGPSIQGMATALRTLDGQIAELCATLNTAYAGGIDIVVLADHGMSAVTGHVDIRKVLARTSLQPGRDYLYFLDSTTVRLWCRSERNLTKLHKLFECEPHMSILDAAACASLGIPRDTGTGDLLVALDEGVVVAPDFFRRSGIPRGMHGYANVASQAGLPYMAAGPGIARWMPSESWPAGHIDVWAAMRAALGLGQESSLSRPEYSTVVA